MTPAPHPLAELFPPMTAAELDALAADIAARGLDEAIVLHAGLILDGRHRSAACARAKVPPRYRIFGLPEEPPAPAFVVEAALLGRPLTSQEMRWLPSGWRMSLPADFTVTGVPGTDALGFVIGRNLTRRHLDESQRAMVAARLATLRPGAQPRPPSPDEPPLPLAPAAAVAPSAAPGPRVLPDLRQAEAAEMMNVSERLVQSATVVRDHGAPELVAAVTRGEVAVSVAEGLARLPVDDQVRLIREAAEPKALARVAKALRAERQAQKKARREERAATLGASMLALPERRYGVIIADPEWRYEPWARGSGMDRAADNHYPTSSIDEICARDVAAIAADDCVLFLWVTRPISPGDRQRVLDAWGFVYVTELAWAKRRPGAARGMGYWVSDEHEVVILARRGNPPMPAPGTQARSWFEAPIGEHSAKPLNIHEIAEAYFPGWPKIELNARAARPGWDVWGAEAPEVAAE